MELSAEIRWFFAGAVEKGRTFAERMALGPPRSRRDRYLVFPSPALGVKLREGNLEIKHRLGTRMEADWKGMVEHWVKWSGSGLDEPLPGNGTWVEVVKKRRLAVFEARGPDLVRLDPDASAGEGCNLEFTELTLDKESSWWTVGLEAYGAINREARLFQTLTLCQEHLHRLPFAGDCSRSYPEWLESRFMENRGA